MGDLSVWAYSGEDADLGFHPVRSQGGGSVTGLRLRSLLGSTGVHLALAEKGRVVLRVEVEATGEEEVRLDLESGNGAPPRLSSPGRPLLTLPVEELYQPPPAIRPAPSGSPLDLVFIVDGTARVTDPDAAVSPRASHLLDDPIRWSERVRQLVAIAEALADRHRDPRVTVLVFGDEKPPGVTAPDLLPSYRLLPERAEDRVLRSLSLPSLEEHLTALRGSSGVDFVDSLAEALEAASQLPYRPGARRIAVILGDSPGFSLRHPAPPRADAQVRRKDVDSQAFALYRCQVEVATLYLDGLAAADGLLVDYQRPLVDFARRQYARLASTEALAWRASTFDLGEALEALSHPSTLVGRDASPGWLVEVVSMKPAGGSRSGRQRRPNRSH
jgi:hypothetical protein